MDSEDLSAGKQAAREAFQAAIAPVERLADDFLSGPGLDRCEEAFERDPEAFAVCVKRTLSRRNIRSPLGLLVKIVNEEHATVSKVRSDRQRSSGSVAITPAEGAERWMRETGFRFQLDDARDVLGDTFRLAGDELNRLLLLHDELQRERAAARLELQRSLRGAAA